MSPYCSADDEWLIMNTVWFNLHMTDGAIHYKFYLKLTMAVDNFVFRIIKGAF